jgi:predicted amidohydrolase YtcJ
MRGWTFRFAVRLLGLLAAGGWLVMAAAQDFAGADILLRNGKVVTVDAAFSVHEAVAIAGGKVLAVGSSADLDKLRTPRTRVIDLAGRTVLPGIIDTHVHLMDYALYHAALEVAPEIANPFIVEAGTVTDILDVLGKRIAAAPPEKEMPWLVYEIQPGRFDSSIDFGSQVDRRALDKLVPARPLLVRMNNVNFELVNSAALTQLQTRFSTSLLKAELDGSGNPTGRLGTGSVHSLAIAPAKRPGLPAARRTELLARAYKKEMEEWASYGVTTWASKLDSTAHAAFSLLNRTGEMPIRLAYSLEDMTADTAAFMPANVEGSGTPHLWITGIYGGSADSDMAGPMCSTIPLVPRDFGLTGPVCSLQPGGEHWDRIYAAVRAGWRIGGFHNHGDLGTDHILMLIERASAEAGMTAEQVRAKRHVIDHCAANPRPDQMRKGLELGVIWTCTTKYVLRADFAAKNRDAEKLSQFVVPLKTMVKAGLRPAFHTDGHDGGPLLFLYLQTMLTRRDTGSGRVWNPSEALSREEAVRSATEWGAEYTLKEKELGTLEPGKWADLIVLDRDILAIPVDDISRTSVLLTMVGGRVVFERPGSKLVN